MDSEVNAMVNSTATGNMSQNESTLMETNENDNQENIGDTSGLSEHQNEDQQSHDNVIVAVSAEKLNLSASSLAAQSEQLDASHDNLATLAAVSAAGAEVNANQTQKNQTQAMDVSSITNQPTAEEVNNNLISNNANTNTHLTHSAPISRMDEEDAKWHTVGFFNGLSTTVTSYVDNLIWSSSGLNLNAEDIPDLGQNNRINLEPGTAYRFRIRALNSVGTSEWSEISSFKTCLPGFPGAPSAIKISKSSEGAHLTWEPPPSCISSIEIVEYSVYLAVKPGKEKETKTGQRTPAQLAFVRVYVGAANQCTVSHTSLSAAHVDCSNKPAIIFRIAARNEKGYGPATQVRWLQDPVQTSVNNPSLGPSSLLSPSRVKPELGASTSKRFKAAVGGGR